MIYKGSNKIEEIHKNNFIIDKIYKGSTLLYEYNTLKFTSAGITYVPGRYDGSGNIVDGNNMYSAAKCLCLVRSDGAAKAIPFELSTESVLLAPTDEQIAASRWYNVGDSDGYGTITVPYTSEYQSGFYTGSGWEPAKASMYAGRCLYNIPTTINARSILASQIGINSNTVVPNYEIVCSNGKIFIYYSGNLIKTLTNATL